MHETRDHEEMRQAFLAAFEKWWPFATARLVEGEWVVLSITLEVKGGPDYKVHGNLDSSEKIIPNAKQAKKRAA